MLYADRHTDNDGQKERTYQSLSERLLLLIIIIIL
jgi:hypothetical protein